MTTRSTAALLSLLAFVLVPHPRTGIRAQSSPPERPTQSTPMFRSRADAVWLPVFVADSDGRPVRGLTVDDFELFENRKPREITTFEAVDLPLPAVRETLAGEEEDVRTNEHPSGRVYIFALGVADPCMALRTRFHIKEFLKKYFGPHDIAAVTQLGRGLRTDGQAFTSSVRLIAGAVDKFSGGFGACVEDAHFEKSGDSGAAPGIGQDLRELIEVLATVEGRHKTMLYFSEHAAFDWFDVVDFRGGVGSRALDDARAGMSAATRANLTIYPIDPRGLTAGDAMGGLERRMLLRAMGRATGGFATTGTNTFAESFDRIGTDASSFYMLGFNSGYEKDDGRFVDVSVRVKRPGLTVRTREGYVPLTRRQRDVLERRPRPPSTGVLGALASPVSTHAGIPLRVHAIPFRVQHRLAQVVLTIETNASALSFAGKNGTFAGQIDLRHLASDDRKRIFPEIRVRGNVVLQRDAHARAVENGVRFVSVVDLPPGRYQLRIASASGNRTGSVVYDLDVPDFAGAPLTLSGLALTTARAALAPTALIVNRGASKPANCGNNSCTAPRVLNTPWQPYSAAASQRTHTLATALPGPPTNVRQFDVADVLTVYAEAYDNRQAATRQRDGVPAVMTTISSAAGAVVYRTLEQHPAPASDGSAVVYQIRANVPLAGLTAGAYVLEVAVAPYGEAEPWATRRIPIQVR